MPKIQKITRILLRILVSFLLFGILLTGLYHVDNKYTNKNTQPICGILALNTQDFSNNGLFFLAREWQYYPDRLLTPSDFTVSMTDLSMHFQTIGRFNDFSMGNLNRSPYGQASYRLALQLPQAENTYSLVLPEIYSSYELYANDTLLCSMGNPTGHIARIGRQTITFSAGGTVQLLLCVSNHMHYYSGLTFPPVFGQAQTVNRFVMIRLFVQCFFCMLVFFIMISALYFGFQLKMPMARFYALLCLCLLYTLALPLFLSYFSTSQRLVYALELVCIYGMYLLLILLQQMLYHTKNRAYPLVLFSISVFILLAALYGFIPINNATVHAVFSNLSFLMKLICALYLLYNAAKSIYQDSSQPGVLLILSCLFAVSLLFDRLFPLYEPIYGYFFSSYGGFVLVLGLGRELFMELSNAYHFKLTFESDKRRIISQVKMQKEYYSELKNKVAQSARERHDMRHHLRAIYHFLEQADAEKAIQYMDRFDSRIKDTSLDGKTPPPLTYCENSTLDAIFSSYARRCQKDGISFVVDCDIPDTFSMDDVDMNILFGNLIENAYKACQAAGVNSLAAGKATPQIHIVGKLKEAGLFFRIENTLPGPVHKRKDRFLSTKHEGYGIGTESARMLTREYDGVITFEQENGQFLVSIMLPM